MTRFERDLLWGFFLASLPLGRILAWVCFLFLAWFSVAHGGILVALLLAVVEYRYLRRRFLR